MELQARIEYFFSRDIAAVDRSSALEAFAALKAMLNSGHVRAAHPGEAATGWIVNEWVKKGILLGFRLGELTDISINDEFCFFDKHTYPLKKLTTADQVRIVPGGSSIRDGAFVAKGVVVMPPAYINVGAYVDEETLVDSHALVGSCAQIGKRVHLSAAAQVGGVLEPIGAYPVIVEDEVFVGGNCGIYEGTIVKRRAVIAAGVILTGSTPVFDIVKETIYRRAADQPLVIPEGAVVVPGTRKIDTPFAREHNLSMNSPIIVKYRDANTDASTVLERSLRDSNS